jgi:hypothetical protein
MAAAFGLKRRCCGQLGSAHVGAFAVLTSNNLQVLRRDFQAVGDAYIWAASPMIANGWVEGV